MDQDSEDVKKATENLALSRYEIGLSPENQRIGSMLSKIGRSFSMPQDSAALDNKLKLVLEMGRVNLNIQLEKRSLAEQTKLGFEPDQLDRLRSLNKIAVGADTVSMSQREETDSEGGKSATKVQKKLPKLKSQFKSQSNEGPEASPRLIVGGCADPLKHRRESTESQMSGTALSHVI